MEEQNIPFPEQIDKPKEVILDATRLLRKAVSVRIADVPLIKRNADTVRDAFYGGFDDFFENWTGDQAILERFVFLERLFSIIDSENLSSGREPSEREKLVSSKLQQNIACFIVANSDDPELLSKTTYMDLLVLRQICEMMQIKAVGESFCKGITGMVVGMMAFNRYSGQYHFEGRLARPEEDVRDGTDFFITCQGREVRVDMHCSNRPEVIVEKIGRVYVITIPSPESHPLNYKHGLLPDETIYKKFLRALPDIFPSINEEEGVDMGNKVLNVGTGRLVPSAAK